ncbi:hypothetical protein NESM_000546600 [Novymonas esmeraldas]|uniref:Uncharacterized protein n=1 Tax=Novymonas esmeraldas TaxID=1808958 RepID=A0AAW0ERJ2_9TRYP
MELLGREAAGVVSTACSAASATSFATLSSQGSLTLWDVRLPRRRNYMTLHNPNRAAAADASELLYLHDRHTAVALCGNTVQLFDTRKCISCVSELTHDAECVAQLRGAPPAGCTTTLIADEEGAMFAYDVGRGTRVNHVEPYVFGTASATLPATGRFGSLSNYCSGLHCVDVGAARLLLAVGMDGAGALYSAADGAHSTRTSFSVACEPPRRGDAQMVNPPLVNCTAVCGARVAVGRADGMYSVYDAASTGLEEAMASPGHAVNGLCYVDWVTPEVLLTVSLCGDVSGWAVGAFMAGGSDGEEEEEEVGPAAVAALAHRDVDGCRLATVNCADRLESNRYVIGDHLGGVVLAALDL